jgi:hypothetical protein
LFGLVREYGQQKPSDEGGFLTKSQFNQFACWIALTGVGVAVTIFITE